jgi:uncharacterized protein (DUF1778 family)
MNIDNINKNGKWLVTIASNHALSNKEKDFIIDLISEEARKTIGNYSFIIHDVLESQKYLMILIEGSKIALRNILSVCNDNIPYTISYERYDK